MSIVKNYITIRARLIKMGVLEVAILNDLSNRVCAPNERENLNLHILNVMTGIKSKCECKFDGRKCNSNQK